MTDDELIDPDDVSEDSIVLQCGRIVGDDGSVIGRINTEGGE